MQLFQFVIDKGHGRIGNGLWCTGNSAGPLLEVDLIDKFAEYFLHEIHRLGTRHRVLETRTGKGKTPALRASELSKGEVLISLHFNSEASKLPIGSISHNDQIPEDIAFLLSKTIELWGVTTSKRYKRCKIIKGSAMPELSQHAPALIISPFQLGVLDDVILSARISTLASDLAWQLTNWAKELNPSISRFCPLGYEPPARQRPVQEFYR